MRSRPVASSPHHGQTSIQSSTLAAVRADVLVAVVTPLLGPAAPGAVRHRVHHATAAPPAAAPLVLEPFRSLERLGARRLVRDVAPAPGTEREGVGDDPAAVVALGARRLLRVAPLQPPPAVGAVRPEALQLRTARRAAQLRRRHLATPPHGLSHGRALALRRRSAG